MTDQSPALPCSIDGHIEVRIFKIKNGERYNVATGEHAGHAHSGRFVPNGSLEVEARVNVGAMRVFDPDYRRDIAVVRLMQDEARQGIITHLYSDVHDAARELYGKLRHMRPSDPSQERAWEEALGIASALMSYGREAKASPGSQFTQSFPTIIGGGSHTE